MAGEVRSLHLFKRELKKIKTIFKYRKCYFTCFSFELGVCLFEIAPKKGVVLVDECLVMWRLMPDGRSFG